MEVDGNWRDLSAQFAVGASGLDFTKVSISIPEDLLDAVKASSLELRIACDPDLQKDRLIVLFRMPGNR